MADAGIGVGWCRVVVAVGGLVMVVEVWGGCFGGGPVQIAHLGVSPNEWKSNPARRHGVQEEILSLYNRSSRDYPSVFHFVITGVIGF